MPEFKATLHAVQGDYFYCVWFDLLMMLLICHCPWPRTHGTHAAQLHSTSHQAQHPLLQKWAWRENHCFCLSRVSLPLLTYKFSKAYPFISAAQSCPTLCDPMYRSTPGLPVHHQLLKFTQIPVHWVGDAIQPSHPLSSTSLPALIFPSIRVFSNKSALSIRWPKYWSFSFNISLTNERPGLISFRMDWLDLLAVRGTLKSLLQHHSSKAPILQCSVFFIVQLSHPYMTTGKTIALNRWTFVDKVMSLLFNMLS